MPKAQIEKLQEIVCIANDYDVPILTVGDVFDTDVVSNLLVNKIGNILNQLNNDLYFVWGNHDLKYHSLDLWAKTSLGVLLTNNPKVKHISEFQKFPIDYLDWEQPIQENQYKESRILIAHKAIVSDDHLRSNSWMENDSSFCMPIHDKKINIV